MTKRRAGAVAALIAIVGALLFISSGCGGDSASSPGTATAAGGSGDLDRLDAQAILDRAKAAATAATSVHVEGAGTADGQPIAIDMDFHKGSGGAGSIEAGGLKFDLVVVEGDVYVRGDDAFYRQVMGTSYNETIAGLPAGRYLKAPVSDPRLGGIANFGDMEAFVSSILDPDGAIAKGQGRTIDGIGAVALTSTADDGTTIGTMYVANDGSDLPLLFDSPGEGSIALTKWGKVAAVVAPPADQVLDVGELIK